MPDLNSGKPWSKMDLFDLRNSVECGTPIREVAEFLCRDLPEVRAKARELGLVVIERKRPLVSSDITGGTLRSLGGRTRPPRARIPRT
jgi:hypothetical protein